MFVLAFVIATLASIPPAFGDLSAGYTGVAAMGFLTTFFVGPLALVVIWRRPRRFEAVVTAMFAAIFAGYLVETTLFGGLFPSGLVVIFGMPMALAAVIAISVRAAICWLVVFTACVAYAVVIPRWVEPTYRLADPEADAAFNLIVTGIFTIAVLAYFVRQRDRFQKRSDDLLYNILPNEIAARLMDGNSMIADDIPAASVLFADIVGFTPMSARMSPAELVGLLNEVFTAFDGFTAELGLEKIKTVGDEYMAAAGIPRPRPDHAQAMTDLAVRMRDHLASNPVRGHHLSLRIGVNSGPVTAGIIGSHKFAYDLWGDTVNTASRMESEGIPGSIQVTSTTYELIRDAFKCEARGLIEVKGKGSMCTYLVIARRPPGPSEAR